MAALWDQFRTSQLKAQQLSGQIAAETQRRAQLQGQIAAYTTQIGQAEARRAAAVGQLGVTDRELASLRPERTFLVATHDPARLAPLASDRLAFA